MAKTYTFNSTEIGVGLHSGWSGDWNNFYLNTSNRRVGKLGNNYYAALIKFVKATDGSTTLTSLASKTITSITLKIQIASVGSGIPSSGALNVVRAKKTSGSLSGSGSEACRCTTPSTPENLADIAGSVSGGYLTLTFSKPKVVLGDSSTAWGYVLGPAQQSVDSYFEIGTAAAVLTVTTNEVDSFTVTYRPGTNGTGSVVTDTKTNGVALTLRGAIYTRTGYTQTGWATSDGGSKAYNLSASYTTNASITLYPFWTINTYTVSYNKGSNGTGTNIRDTKTYGTALTLKGAIFTRTGYTQTGWSTSDGGSKVYNLSASYTANAAATLYPYWTIITYTISYNANGGSGAPSAQTKTYNVTLTLSSTKPTRTGYTFLGWSTSNTATTATYSAGGSYTANASATLYAVWKAVTYTVSYNKGSNGTGTNTSDTKTYNVTLTLKGAIFTRSGYTQTGWATSDGGAQAYALSASYTANAAVTLYPVWTAGKSTISTPNGTLGTAQTITITRYSSSYTHTLTYKYGSATGTIVTKTSSTTPSWTPATSLASQFPSATSGTCTITCETFNGNTSLGTTTTTCTLSIPSIIKATISSVSLSETVSGIAAQFGGFVQNKSKAKVTVNTSTANAGGATVRSYSISINGQTLTSNNATTSLLATSGSNSYKAKITDSRGRTSESTGTFTVLAYNVPSVSETAQRNATTATTINVNYSWTISAVNNHNTKTVKIKYRTFGSSSAATTATTITPSAYSGNGSYAITGLDADTAYDVWVEVTDYFGTVSATSTVAGNANRIYHISKTDKTVARHGANPSDGWDHQFFNEQFHGVVDITPRRCYAELSSAGWYRVIQYTGSKTDAQWARSVKIDITITTAYRNTNNSLHAISMLGVYYDRVAFVNETSYTNVTTIDKIRYAYGADGNGYIDIHYNSNVMNDVAVDFNVHYYMPSENSIASVPMTAVADSPANETVMTEYSFVANTDIVGSPTLGEYGTAFENGGYVRKINGIVYLRLNVTVKDTPAGAWRSLFTIPTGFTASVSHDFFAMDNSTDAAIHARVWGNGTVSIWPNSAIPSGRLINCYVIYPII